MSRTTVTVVIPTIGRGELTRAIESALAQDVASEVLVVWDAETEVDAALAADTRVTVLRTAGRMGGAHARNLGVEAATSPWLAFLDDDDEWLPGKLAAQLAVAVPIADAGGKPLVSCQSFTRSTGSDELTSAVPAQVYAGGPVEDYLFQGRRLGFQRPALHVPTLLTTTAFAQEIGWDESLRRHQDWDWTLRASRAPGFVLRQVPEPLAIVDIGSPGSVSASADWVTTWEWGRQWREDWHPKTYADYMVGQVVRQAFVAHDPAAALMAADEARSAAWPSLGTVLLGTSAIVPRSVLARGAQTVGRATALARSRGSRSAAHETD